MGTAGLPGGRDGSWASGDGVKWTFTGDPNDCAFDFWANAIVPQGPDQSRSIRADSQWYLCEHINNFFETGQAKVIQKIDAIEGSVMRELAALRTFMGNKCSVVDAEEDSPFRVRSD